MNANGSWRLRSYRRWVGRAAESLLKSRTGRELEEQQPAANEKQPTTPASGGSIRHAWLHAASVGELEMLWPVAEELAARGQELTLTVFSESARAAVTKLAEAARARGGRIRFAGFSPLEGTWGEALARARPKLFVSAKYEAWPELWASLAEQGIPLAVVGARDRKSLRLGAIGCRALGVALPKMLFIAARQQEGQLLTRRFGSRARVETLGEPRWDRVAARLRAGNERAKKLIELLSSSPRPWGVFGSAWPDDLEVWGNALSKLPGTLWIVPHRVDAEAVKEVVERLEKFLPGPIVRTSPIDAGSTARKARCIVVDEMGFLSELYGAADWAYVGGGFGKGLHSVIEPAIAGLPVLGGPSKAREFPEVLDLLESGQLALVENEADAWRWAEQIVHGEILASGLRSKRRAEAEARLGAARRVADALERHAGWT